MRLCTIVESQVVVVPVPAPMMIAEFNFISMSDMPFSASGGRI